MTPLAAAAVWALAGLVAAAVLPPLHLRRLAALVPIAGTVAVLLTSTQGPASLGYGTLGTLVLDRVAQGVLIAGGLSLFVTLLLSPNLEAAEMRMTGLAGAAAVILVTAADAVVWGLAAFGAAGLIALRWISAAPSRTTLAAGRVAVGGAALLLGAAPFLPLTGAPTGPRPVVIAALLACGLAALIGLLPLGGWAGAGVERVRLADSAAWALLLAPAALLSAERVGRVLPAVGVLTFDHLLLALGLLTAVWNAGRALRVAGRARYARMLTADFGLAAAAIGAARPAVALSGGLFVLLTQLALAPVLLQEPTTQTSSTTRLAWVLLSGVPPAPSFWGRFLLLQALAQVSALTLAVAIVAMGMLFLAAILGARGDRRLPPVRAPVARPPLAAQTGAWLVVAAASALGIASQAGATLFFGGA